MATVDCSVVRSNAAPVCGPPAEKQQMHRISAVRKQQRVSLRTAARQMHTEIRKVREQEEESADLRLSDLYRWQDVLEVPVADLLMDPGTPLSRPVMERAQMVRLMKTAMAIFEHTESVAVQRMAQMLVEQLTDIMPELEDVNAWHAVGQRRSMDEMGRVSERPIPESCFGNLAAFLDE